MSPMTRARVMTLAKARVLSRAPLHLRHLPPDRVKIGVTANLAE